jgi:alpha-L-rhamnosidase
LEIRSGTDWKVAAGDEPNWTSVDFDDSAWANAAVVGKPGDPPWTDLTEVAPPRQSICMRKEFAAGSGLKRARVYVSGLGIYELHLNGQRVGEDIFTPGWTHYYKRVQYQTYDVTDQIRKGENVIGAVLGNGWWSGGLGWRSADQYSKGDLRLIAELHIDYEDGLTEIVVTDGSWKAFPSPITRNTYYHGETHDARKETPGWDAPGFDDARWWPTSLLEEPVDHLVAQRCQTIQVTQELPVHAVSEPDPGVYIFDFNQNASGRARLTVRNAEPGTRIRLRFGEELDPNGRLYRDNYRSAEATDYYICKGGAEEVWEPIFTYRGFRYCEITGYPVPPKQTIPNDALVFRVLHSAAPEAGSFECSHWLINQIHHNVAWGLRSNMHSVVTDCPQRDERLGWMGDGQAFAHTSCFLRDMSSFYEKWLVDMTDSQSPEGAVTDVSPAKVVHGAAKPGWGDAVIIVPYTVYRFYGDTRIIEDNYDGMRAWIEYMRSQSKDDLYETPGYGDWVAVVPSPTEWIGSAYYYYSTKLFSEMAAAIGKTGDAKEYAALADRIAAAFNRKHLNRGKGSYVTGTQTCNILPLFFGITPTDLEAKVLENIADDIRARGDHLSTGFMGTTYLMPLLADRGQQELAYRLAVQDSYPSWGYMIREGATTIWERWDTDKRGPEMNSRNHFAFGTVVRWFFEDLAGIQLDPDVPGYKHFVIRPRPAGDLQWARATYPSIYGGITSDWRLTDDGIRLKVAIPANTSARVHVPTCGKREVSITESDRVLIEDGRPGGSSPGVTFVALEDDRAVFDLGAGDYEFVLEGK